jgi:integrase
MERSMDPRAPEPSAALSRREAPLPLPELCVAALKLRRDQQEADRIQAAGGWVDTGLVFTTRHGTALEPRNFSRSFDRCIVKAQVPRITVHGTRKTCGSLLAALDVHPRVAMRSAGPVPDPAT